jgi:Peptidase family M1 domain
MEGRFKRAGGASLVALAVLAVAPAAQAAGVGVTSLSSLPAGARAGNLTGVVTNEGDSASTAKVSVRVMRRGTGGALIGKASVSVAAHATKSFLVDVKLPSNLKKGTYYVAACTPQGGPDAGKLGCATSAANLKIKGGDPVRGALANKAFDAQNGASSKARASQAPACSPGARTLSEPGNRVWPELGNGGYKSIHTDVFTVYDADTNLFLPGNHVELTQKATQCLTEFSLDFDAHSQTSATNTVPPPPGSDMTIQSITIDGVPATFQHKQPTYPGDPNGPDDPNPLAHTAGNTIPVSATNPNPPACAPTGNGAALQGVPCSPTKLVITPAQPIPDGTTFKVVINYTGRPGVRGNPSLGNEGWFKNDSPAKDGAMVTSEPSGSMAWMPLNNQASVKPTYDIHSTVNYDPATAPELNRVFIGNGRLVSTVVNPPDANYPTGGSRTFNWHSTEPIASYLVENSVGHFDASERMATAGDVIYYEYQGSNITPTRKVTNKAIMDMQEDITHFQEQQVNGPFQFNANGIVVAAPSASFEEEMQTKIVFVGGNIGTTAQTFSHENMHQWWGDAVSYAQPKYTFFKEGYADMSEYLFLARVAGLAAGPEGSDAYNAAFEASIVTRWTGDANNRWSRTSTTFWNVAPDNPTSGNLFSNANTYSRPGMSYIALRAILGKDNFRKASTEIQTSFRYGAITPAEEIAIFHKYMPNKSLGCSNKLDAFFKQWWDTSYTGSPQAGNRPSITGPGLPGGGFYDANGGCSDYGNDQPSTPSATVPAQLALSLGTAASFGAFTPGVGKDYTANTTANVISTAGDATLAVTDPSATAPGHLVNGAFSLPAALKAVGTSPAGTSAGAGSVSGAPLTLTTWSNPVSNDPVQVLFTQTIGANDALRTGSYAKTLTFTLSTTTP